MPKKLLQRYLPSASKVRELPALKPISGFLQDPSLWHMNRRSVAGAFFIGLFCAFLPVPFQMVFAAVLALVSRCNLPISVSLVWITNPLTIPPMFYFAYRLGAWLLDRQLAVPGIELSWDWLSANFVDIGYPLLFGSLVCGWVAGVTAFVVVRVTWRFHVITRWQERRAKIRARRAAGKAEQHQSAP